MTDYNEITPNEIDPGSPLNVSLFTRLVDNPIAAMEGAAGAPRLAFEAIPDVVAGDQVRLSATGNFENGSEVFQTGFLWSCPQNGTIRLSVGHRRSSAAADVQAEVLVGGASVALYTHRSTSEVVNTVDFPVSRNDLIEVRIRRNGPNDFGVCVLTRVDLSTDGGWIFPLAPVLTELSPQWTPI